MSKCSCVSVTPTLAGSIGPSTVRTLSVARNLGTGCCADVMVCVCGVNRNL